MDQNYLRYTNARYGFSIIYPSNFLSGEEPTNGDGLKFFSPDGLETITAYGSNDSAVFEFKNVKDAMEFEMKNIDANISYKHMSKNWFVLSYKKYNKIYYSKTYVGKGSTNTLLIEYPESLKEKYDKLIPELIKGFRPGDLDSCH